MKHTTLALLAILFAGYSNAQFSKGDKYISGGISFSHAKTESLSEQKNTSFSFSPAFIKFRSEKKAVGFALSFAHIRQETDAVIPQNTKRYTAGAEVFIQNILPLGKGFYVYAQPGVAASYGWGTSVSSGTTWENKWKSYGVAAYLTPGIGYKFSNRLLAAISFNNAVLASYSHISEEDAISNNTSKGNSFSLSSGLFNSQIGNLGFSLAYKLR